MGVLTGIPFAFLYYSFMGIPIAAWADRSNRRNCSRLPVASWSAMTAIFGMSVNYAILFAARLARLSEKRRQPPVALADLRLLLEEPAGTAFSISPSAYRSAPRSGRARRLGQPAIQWR